MARRRSRENPDGMLFLVLGGLAAAGVVGYLVWKNSPAGAGGSVVGTPQPFTIVTSGDQGTATLSLSSQNAIIVTPGTVSGQGIISFDSLTASGPLSGPTTIPVPEGQMGSAGSQFVATGTGSGVITATWQDINSQTQTSTIEVTINA
jgi:hypothetical protein